LPEKCPKLLKKLLNVKQKSMFQHFNTLILSELLSSNDFEFICKVKNTFLALDRSAFGELSFEDFKIAYDDEIQTELTEEKLLKIF
jgi:hypothetical protein